MSPEESRKRQIEMYREMTGEQRLLIGLRLHELGCNMARDAIRQQLPEATPDIVEEQLRARLRLAYDDLPSGAGVS